MTREHTHTIAITVLARYPHGKEQRTEVALDGEGDLEHHLEAFRTILVACGFACSTAASLDVSES